MKRRLTLLILLVVGARFGHAETDAPLHCDREMRKTIESLQAWRRLHDGAYPERIVQLKEAGLLPTDGALCPAWRLEQPGANPAHTQSTSLNEHGDPSGTYEYELSESVEKSSVEKMFLPTGTIYTRGEVKAALLRRPFFEQIPLIRCRSHRADAPASFANSTDIFRNATVEGKVYWSGLYWEQLWLADVPYCAREANVLFGLEGPPFNSGRAPALTCALDLRRWTCAFGDRAWWWTYPYFDLGINRQLSAHLEAFFEKQHGRVMQLAGTQWWIDGLVQLQGRVRKNPDKFHEPGMEGFVSERTGVRVGRKFQEASWLQGSLWFARKRETVGWLVWHYADSTEERVPIIYGVDTARFWADSEQLGHEKDFPEPVWKHHETAQSVGKERWLRIFQQTWTNPRPEVPVATLDFVSNTNSPASPFLVAINISP